MSQHNIVLVTPRSAGRSGHAALERIERAGFTLVFPSPGRQPTESELLAAVPEAVGYLAGVEPISRAVIAAATGLRAISRNGVGIDNVDIAAAREYGIAVLTTRGANSRGAAELTIAHMLDAARGVVQSAAALRSGRWEREKGIELYGRTLGIIGCGHVGRLVAESALGLGMRVLCYDHHPKHEFQPGPGFSHVDLHTVLTKSDVVSMHARALPGGEPMIGDDEIAAMKSGAILLNTARESLVDRDAILRALDTGHLRAATIDAFTREPPDHSVFLEHPRVLATPHIGSFTEESVDRAMHMAADNLIAHLADSGGAGVVE